MKTFIQVCTLSLLAGSSLIVAAGEVPASFSECLSFAPDDQKFSINLEIKVDTTTILVQKSGGWQMTNAAGPDISEEEKASFEPMVKCLNGYLLK